MELLLFLIVMGSICALLLVILLYALRARRCYVITYTIPYVAGASHLKMRLYVKSQREAWQTFHALGEWTKHVLIHSIKNK